MGLRLYQPPVESDIPSKPAVDRSARSRSIIRRNVDLVRERRRRVLAAAAAYDSYGARRGQATTDTASNSPPPATTDGPEHGRPALRDASGRIRFLDTMFGDRWAHLHTESNPSPLRDDNNDPSPMTGMAVGPQFLDGAPQPPRRPDFIDAAFIVPNDPRLRRREPTYALSSMRSTQAPNHPSRRSTTAAFSRIRRQRSSLRDESRASPDAAGDGSRPRDAPSSRSPWTTTEAGVDGLGDRNRSLSPEGDNVWDTLLSTLAPDPQPPSVGSSFASASAASAAATQSTAAASSRTSFTTPDAAEESAFEPPCESGCDNSDTEGEEDDEMETQLHLLSRIGRTRLFSNPPPPPPPPRNNEDPLELLGGIGGMQRIVRNLARREDIPDEWWADAGLSRTLSREASGN